MQVHAARSTEIPFARLRTIYVYTQQALRALALPLPNLAPTASGAARAAAFLLHQFVLWTLDISMDLPHFGL
jgi:hypothetical protein